MLKIEILEGNKRKFTGTFKVPDASGTLTDPTTVKVFRQRIGADPSTAETYDFALSQVTKESVGIYSKVLSFPDDGAFAVGFEGTGACEAYDEAIVIVGNAKARP